MVDSKVYLNGELIVVYFDGYIFFSVCLIGKLNDGVNILIVIIDGSENFVILFFGYVIDYLIYVGIYCDVWFKVLLVVFIGLYKIEMLDVLVDSKIVIVCVVIDGFVLGGIVIVMLIDSIGIEIVSVEVLVVVIVDLLIDGLIGIDLWLVENFVLY